MYIGTVWVFTWIVFGSEIHAFVPALLTTRIEKCGVEPREMATSYGGVQMCLCQFHVRRSCQVYVVSVVHFIVRRTVFSPRSLAVVLFLRGFLSNACGYGSVCIVFCTVASIDIRCRCRVGLRSGVRFASPPAGTRRSLFRCCGWKKYGTVDSFLSFCTTSD